MTHHWDEFSKSLAEPAVPRRESLRLLGAALTGALLSPLGAGATWAAGDPCRDFCKCRNKRQLNACLAACRACDSQTSRLCGSCARGYACTDLASDFNNCGRCGAACADPGPYEDGACVDGQCFYRCVDGATDCGGTCTDLRSDFDNCGACGLLCADPGPYENGACVDGHCFYWCASGAAVCGDGTCTNLGSDPNNCGACGNVCPESAPHCDQGVCVANDCVYPLVNCGGVCVDIFFDSSNCGACGNVCPPEFYYCSYGACWDPICQFVEC